MKNATRMESQKQLFLDAYEQHAEAIYRHCFFRMYSRETAEDAMQETFIKTWNYLSHGGTIQNIRAFLYRVANNLIIDHTRKKKSISLDALLEEDESQEPMSKEHIQILRSSEMREALEKIASFPEEERTLIVMRFIDDMGPSEIATATGMTPNNVSVKLNRIVEKIKSQQTI